MSFVAAAIGGGALIGAGASIYASNKQSDAANNALQFQQNVLGQNQANAKPFIGAGTGALDRLNTSYNDPTSVTNTPDYKFGVTQGMDALQNSAAARGGALSGNFLRSADQFGQDYATNYLGNYRSGNLAIANMGSGAAGNNANASNTSAGQIGNSYNYLGGAQASGAVGAANAFTGGAQNYLLYNALSKSSYGQPSGGMFGGSDLSQSAMGGGFGGAAFG